LKIEKIGRIDRGGGAIHDFPGLSKSNAIKAII
jgi:hypothetical protein